MKKISLFSLICLLSLIVVTQAKALEIEVSDNGTVKFYDDQVLGKNTTGETDDQPRQLLRSVPASENKQINLQPKANSMRVEMQDKTMEKDQDRLQLHQDDRMEVGRMQLEAPVSQNQKMMRTETETGTASGETLRERLRQERQERSEETMQIKNQVRNGDNELQLQTRNVKARLSQGAEFTLDPKTSEVTVTTPSGETHILNHLPDQAITSMTEAGFFGPNQILANDIEVDTSGDQIKYKAKIQENKRFLGLFRRQVEKDVVLDDQTGEIVEVNKPAIQQILDFLSF